MNFVNPFPGRKPGDTLTKREIISALRMALCAEEEAIHLYDMIAEFVNDEDVKKIMTDIADEEQIHVGEIQKLLKEKSDDETEMLDKGEGEVVDKIAAEL